MKKLTAKSPYARISVAEEDVDDEHTNGNGHGGPHTASPTITRAHLSNGAHAIADDALTLEVDGMMCGHCVSSVHAALVGVPGVASADVDLDGGRATLAIRELFFGLGFDWGAVARLSIHSPRHFMAQLACRGARLSAESQDVLVANGTD